MAGLIVIVTSDGEETVTTQVQWNSRWSVLRSTLDTGRAEH